MKKYYGVVAILAIIVLTGCLEKKELTIDADTEMVGEKAVSALDKADAFLDKTEEVAKDAADAAMEKGGEMVDDATDTVTDAMAAKEYTLADVGAHATRDDCWTVIDGNVADVTKFFGTHPGGDDNLAKACGKDATALFKAQEKHDPNGYAALKKFTIGTLVTAS